MEKWFTSFKEASQFARDLAERQTRHQLKRGIDGYSVEFTEVNSSSEGKAVQSDAAHDAYLELSLDLGIKEDKISELSDQLEASLQALSEEEKRNESLQKERATQQIRIRDLEDAIGSEKRKAREAQAKLEKESTRFHQITEALKKAYTEKFGAAEVESVTRSTKKKFFCNACDGSGGAGRKGCSLCGGTGMVEGTLSTRIDYKVKLHDRQEK